MHRCRCMHRGDNPSSFKQLSFRGFSILPLVGQISNGSDSDCSPYGDMLPDSSTVGYFFWHKRLDARTVTDKG
jgi:hypothetical protein